jgi:hypothetical protein
MLSVPLNMICVTFDLKDPTTNTTVCSSEIFQVSQAIWTLSEVVFYIGVSFLAVHRLRIDRLFFPRPPQLLVQPVRLLLGWYHVLLIGWDALSHRDSS